MCCCKNELPKDIQFIIGDGKTGTPANGSTEYVNSDLEYARYRFKKNGFGTMFPEINYERLSSGGTRLLGGAVFSTGEMYSIEFY